MVESAAPEISLKALREGEGLTQVEVAARMGKSQGEISKIEARCDVGNLLLSTLRAYVRALGGELELSVRPRTPQPRPIRANTAESPKKVTTHLV